MRGVILYAVRLLVTVAFLGAAVWIGRRLWPAIRSEPSTWLGEDWRELVRDRVGV